MLDDVAKSHSLPTPFENVDLKSSRNNFPFSVSGRMLGDRERRKKFPTGITRAGNYFSPDAMLRRQKMSLLTIFYEIVVWLSYKLRATNKLNTRINKYESRGKGQLVPCRREDENCLTNENRVSSCSKFDFNFRMQTASVKLMTRLSVASIFVMTKLFA